MSTDPTPSVRPADPELERLLVEEDQIELGKRKRELEAEIADLQAEIKTGFYDPTHTAQIDGLLTRLRDIQTEENRLRSDHQSLSAQTQGSRGAPMQNPSQQLSPWM